MLDTQDTDLEHYRNNHEELDLNENKTWLPIWASIHVGHTKSFLPFGDKMWAITPQAQNYLFPLLFLFLNWGFMIYSTVNDVGKYNKYLNTKHTTVDAIFFKSNLRAMIHKK